MESVVNAEARTQEGRNLGANFYEGIGINCRRSDAGVFDDEAGLAHQLGAKIQFVACNFWIGLLRD